MIEGFEVEESTRENGSVFFVILSKDRVIAKVQAPFYEVVYVENTEVKS